MKKIAFISFVFLFGGCHHSTSDTFSSLIKKKFERTTSSGITFMQWKKDSSITEARQLDSLRYGEMNFMKIFNRVSVDSIFSVHIMYNSSTLQVYNYLITLEIISSGDVKGIVVNKNGKWDTGGPNYSTGKMLALFNKN